MEFSELVGKTLASVVNHNNEEIIFTDSEGHRYALNHHQDCCESVAVESIIGDLNDLVGTPILVAEEASSEKTPDDVKQEYQPDSQTWTFYKLRTIKGSVDIRWHGESNGYYSESVSFDEVT